LHKALREVLGTHVQQKGSQVTAERTRFDFSHNAPLSADEMTRIEHRVNAEIVANPATQARVLPLDEAKKTGAMMLFGEKYDHEVRVLDIGSSRELCGGTHVVRTGDIGLFKVVSEGGVAAGVRRIEAITAGDALSHVQQLQANIEQMAQSLKIAPLELPTRLNQVLEQLRQLDKQLATLKAQQAASQVDELVRQAVPVQLLNSSVTLQVLVATLADGDAQALRYMAGLLKDKLKSAAIVLASIEGDKVQLLAAVTAQHMAQIKAGELVNFVAQQVGGKGGGKPDLAMAGGTQPAQLPEALSSVAAWIAQQGR
jgi:alanyl-tRNA synthetase